MTAFIKKCIRSILGDKGYEFLARKKRLAVDWVILGKLYPFLYWCGSRKPLRGDKVIFIEPSYSSLSDNYKLIHKRLQDDGGYDIHIHLIEPYKDKKGRMRREMLLLKDVSDAKYIFLDDGFNAFAKIEFRPGTKVVQVWHGCGAFKRFGFGTSDKIFGSTLEEMEKYSYYKQCTHVTVSSPEVVWAYAESMGLPQERIFPIGVSRTDVFFEDSTSANARKKLESLIPQSKEKKVLLYAPTFRGNSATAAAPEALSVPTFYDALRDDYILLIKHHPFVKERPAIDGKYWDFAFDVTDNLDIQELLCIADICISDYSSLIFEYSLFERPMIFFAYDLEDYFDCRGFYYDYDELTPGPVFKTNEEIIEYIRHIDERFDRQKVIDFRNKFMSACDGHATERLIDLIFDKEPKENPA